MEPFRYISFGAGVQSTALLVMSAMQLDRYPCPKADVAIFADTGDEPQWVYDSLGYYDQKFSDKIPIVVVRKPKTLSATMVAAAAGSRFASIPCFTQSKDGSKGMLRRQCTREFKIDVIEPAVSKALKKLGRKKAAIAMLGISVDEASRMKPNRTKWITNEWPLIDARMTRFDCVKFLQSLDLPVPMKSACVFCPFHGDSYWLTLKNHYPKEFEKACAVDDTIRDMSKAGATDPLFVHRSLTPLRIAKFRHEDQRDFFENECEGHCGV